MSMVVNQLEHAFYSSIQPISESGLQLVTKQEIKRKRLLRQTAIAATQTEKKPEHKKKTSQSEDIEQLLVKQSDKSYLLEQFPPTADSYKVYQNGKVKEFFQNESLQSPKRVADICLVNDHYIFVKMPQRPSTPTSYSNVTDGGVRQKDLGNFKDDRDSQKESKPLCPYLRSKRNRITKVTPIHEDTADVSESERTNHAKSYCLNMQSCWQSHEQEDESYQTQMTIRKDIDHSACNNQNTLKEYSATQLSIEPAQCPNTQRSRDIQTISGSLLQSSLQYQVSLHKSGAINDSQHNNNINSVEVINSPRRRKCPRLRGFYWLLRPFREKNHKPKPKIQAVVYKTYFVKWTKPPDTLNHGYGVKSLHSSQAEVSILRRCRSAIF